MEARAGAPRYITSRPRHCGTCPLRGPHLLLRLLLLLSTPPPAPVPLASRRLWAARHCQLRPPPGSPRARRRRAAAAGGRRSLHSGSALGLLPSWAPSSRASPLPPISNYRLRPAEGERGSEAQGEGAREREGGDRAWADFFFKRVGVGVIAGRLLWLLNFKLPCTRLPVCWEQ